MRRTVQDVMTRDVVVARPDTPFKELARLLHEHRIGAVPVLRGSVARRGQALALQELAAAVDGVVAVDSRLVWEHNDVAGERPAHRGYRPKVLIGQRRPGNDWRSGG